VVQPIIPAVQAVQSTSPNDLLLASIEQNVRQGVSTLGTQPLLADAVKAETLQIVGADYHLSSGEVSFQT
jgi:carbonic anhydrase